VKPVWIVLIGIALLVGLLLPAGQVVAQEGAPQGPVYIVQPGDTLWDIAQRFGVPWDELARANGIGDASQLAAGDELIIPGIQGIEGVLVTENIPFGEDLTSLSRRYQVPEETLVRLNHLSSPARLYSGASLIVPDDRATGNPGKRISLSVGESLVELAAAEGLNPWQVVLRNDLAGSWEAIPGEGLRLPVPEAPGEPGPGGLPEVITAVELSPEPLVQGNTGEIRLETQEDIELSGKLFDRDLHFFKNGEDGYVALQGVRALAEPGLYPLALRGRLADGTSFGFEQMVPVRAGDFRYFTLTVPPETIDPAITKPEDEIWNALAEPATPERMWQGVFQFPVAQPSPCGYTSYYGERRSYNGSPYNYFHTGLDFCYNYNLEVNEIYAPADGVVVFAGPMTVRGNATMIDHGWGVYTGYMHQEEIYVKEGERVKAGQVIGIAGETGRVNGPHLHFEVFVGGVQVDPMTWLEQEFP
jgi:murein DD-endopeptidase MepM/ murein hydrolase activator NlpD